MDESYTLKLLSKNDVTIHNNTRIHAIYVTVMIFSTSINIVFRKEYTHLCLDFIVPEDMSRYILAIYFYEVNIPFSEILS